MPNAIVRQTLFEVKDYFNRNHSLLLESFTHPMHLDRRIISVLLVISVSAGHQGRTAYDLTCFFSPIQAFRIQSLQSKIRETGVRSYVCHNQINQSFPPVR